MNELIPLQNPNPAALFVPDGMDDLLARIEADARAMAPDVSTAKGRKAIASTAARVSRSKVYLDNLGKEYVAELKALPKKVDFERKKMRDRLDNLRDEVRKPLTDYEQAEADRVAMHRANIAGIEAAMEEIAGMDSTSIQERMKGIVDMEIDETWEEFQDQAKQAKDATLFRLEAAFESAKRREEEQARQQREREERIAREAAEKARLEAERKALEAARIEAERVEKERLALEQAVADAEAARLEAKRRTEEATRIEAERVEKERAALERAVADAEAARRETERRAKEAEAMAQQKAEDAARRERERIEARNRAIMEEEERRAADREHRARIHRAALTALCSSADIDEDQARKIVVAIASGKIPHISIAY